MADLWSSYASQLPMGASSRDAIVGQTEWGTPVYASPMGVQYWEPLQGETKRGSVARALLDGMRSDPWGAVKSGAGAVASGVAEALTAPYRAWKGEAITNGDVFNTAGIAQLGAMSMKAPEGALRSGAMGSTSAADEVMGLLRSGRGSEVTDDLMAAADQAYLSSIYDLPLDEASRMARAQGMGFDTDKVWYHGTDADFPSFNIGDGRNTGVSAPAVFLTDSPQVARTYGDNLIDVFPRADGVAELDFGGGSFGFINGERMSPAQVTNWLGEQRRDVMARYFDPESEAAEVLARMGWEDMYYDNIDAALMMNVKDAAGDPFSMPTANNMAVFDPQNIRRTSARFDPRLSHLRNLSAGVGGLALLPYLGNEE